MKRKFVSTKIYFIFLLLSSACGTFNQKGFQSVDSVVVMDSIFAFGRLAKLPSGQSLWDSTAHNLTQQAFSITYSTILDNDSGEICILPRDSSWNRWDLQKRNHLPIVVGNTKSSNQDYENNGFPIFTAMQRQELKATSAFRFLDPVTKDTFLMKLSNDNPIGFYPVICDGVLVKYKCLNFISHQNDSLKLQVLASYDNPLILKISNGYTYFAQAISTHVPYAPAYPSFNSNITLHYSASSLEGSMDIKVKILSSKEDTIMCLMKGTVDDSYEYKFANTVNYVGEALSNPQFVPFLPSVILDSLSYTKESMCFVSLKTLQNWYRQNGGQIGVEHFADFDKGQDKEEYETEKTVFMQAYKEGKSHSSYVFLKTNRAGKAEIKKWPLYKFANYKAQCFLEVIPFNGLGVVSRVSSSDMMWDVQLRSISYDSSE